MVTVHAYVEVADLERGVAFYCDGLALRLRRRLSPTWIELEGASLPVFLLGGRPPVAELGSTRVVRSFARHWTPVHLDFVVDDLDAVVARLLALGGTLDRAVGVREYGRIACMADPFGNGFDLIEFSGEGYDGVARLRGAAELPEEQINLADPDAPEVRDWTGAIRGRFRKPA